MKLLSVSLALCTLLTLSRAGPVNFTDSRHMGLCEYKQQHSHNLTGEFVPQCDAHGNFLPQQCSGSTGYCWCVNVFSGEEIPNTKTPPGTAPLNCGLCEYKQQHSYLTGEFVPQCDANGNFLPQQCWASTGYCWCVNTITGEEIPNTKTPPGTAPLNCGLCEYKKQHSHNVIGKFVPQCDANGNFLPQQCSGSTGYCWCVNVFSGKEIPNTKTPPGTAPLNCDSEFSCPLGWSLFGKQCFIFINSPKSWPEAESYCLFEGANLASIHSSEENHFIQVLTRADSHNFPETWIGGHDAVHHCFWMWSDGSKFNYENWYDDDSGETERTENCLKINYGCDFKWNYASCNGTLPFVCAKTM